MDDQIMRVRGNKLRTLDKARSTLFRISCIGDSKISFVPRCIINVEGNGLTVRHCDSLSAIPLIRAPEVPSQ